MLCELVKRGFATSSCLFLRGRQNFRNLPLNRIANPGIQRQIDAYHEVEKDAKLQELDLEDMESDFMNTHEQYDKHQKESKAWKEKVQLEIVRRKYFKNNSPNMLLWAEKEHIRYLHNLDPEAWCIEKLSQSFPATKDTIKKIVRSAWQPKDAERILKHDNSVEDNWRKLEQGKLQVDPAVKQHLKKFTQRSGSKTAGVSKWMENVTIKHDARKPKKSVFGQIINSYSEMREKSTQELEMLTSGFDKDAEAAKVEVTLPQKLVGKQVPNGDSFVLKTERSVTRQQPVTLSKFKEEWLGSTGTEISPAKQITEDYRTVGIEQISVDRNPGHDMFAARVHIPKGKRKKGGTYKVDDCYYDNDGEFLYRVPDVTISKIGARMKEDATLIKNKYSMLYK